MKRWHGALPKDWPEPLTEETCNTRKDHARALVFWDVIKDSDLPAVNKCWHFLLKACIKHFRKYG